jgi:Ca-activated chloride channel homolog
LFRFEHPEFLYWLFLLPVLIFVFRFLEQRKAKQFAAFGTNEVVAQLLRHYAPFKAPLKFGIWLFAAVLLVFAMANPQFGTKKQRVKRKSVDVMLAMDVSRSMQAQDALPSRLALAKQFIGKLVEQLKGNRIGTIMFAGNAYLQMPLTTDYAAANIFIQSADCEMLPTQGTAISEAVELGMESFPKDNKNHRVIIVITDGEDHEEGAKAIVEKAAEDNILVYTIGIGTAQGAPIPETSEDGITKLKLDESGATILSKLNEPFLKELAEAGNGAYFNLANNPDVFNALRKSIDKLEKKEFEARMFSSYESYYQYLVAAALLLLLLETGISYRNTAKWRMGNIFEV